MRNCVRMVVLTVVVLVLASADLWAQCAMCRGSVQSTLGNGRNNVGVGLNTGIVYLFIMPYLIVAIIAYLWYRNSKKDREQQRMVAARVRGAMRG